jgi:endogenous inhibitor of DNA gyrase (YacG/DUF329 family)
MPRRVATDDDWDEGPDGDGDWEPDDEEPDFSPAVGDDDPTMPCPHCGASIHDESEQCPNCGKYISVEDAPPSRKPWWIVLGAILCLYAVYRWTFG